MMLLKNIFIENYKNVKNAKLQSLGDINIIIGPNNAGKTNILELLSRLKKITRGGEQFLCSNCAQYYQDISNEYSSFFLSINPDKDQLLGKEKNRIKFHFEFNDLVLSSPSNRSSSLLENHKCSEAPLGMKVELESSADFPGKLIPRHLNDSLQLNGVVDNLRDRVHFLDDNRMNNIDGSDLKGYVSKREFMTDQRVKWIKLLSDIIDPTITNEANYDLISNKFKENYRSDVHIQGNGLKAALGIITTTEFDTSENHILLIDEPELGLNQAAKLSLIKFLSENSKDIQVFISTQDSTFANPLLYGKAAFSLYLFSSLTGGFSKVDVNHNLEHVSTFGGYLPHTSSLKEFHMYVEGPSDVFLVKEMLDIYIKEKLLEKWPILREKIGVYHLGGDFWPHLISTIPSSPFKCLVLVDGDKKNQVKEIIKNYKNNKLSIIPEITDGSGRPRTISYLGSLTHPKIVIYSLRNKCIEKYFNEDFNCNENINKIHNAILIKKNFLRSSEDIPLEIRIIFRNILSSLGEKVEGKN